MPEIDDVLVPPRRFGSLLRESRVAAGEELSDVAARSEKMTVVDLDDLEHGRRSIDDGLLVEVVEMYGMDASEMFPQRTRLMIDLNEGVIAVDTTQIAVETAADADAVLIRYLALVHRLRGQSVGTTVQIRELDVGILASALELHDGEIERRLHRLMGDEAVEVSARKLRKRLVLPLAGVVVAITAVGVLVLVADDGPGVDGTDPSQVMMNIEAQTGTAIAVQSPALARNVAPASATGVTPVPETDVGEAAVVEAVVPAPAPAVGAEADATAPAPEATATPEAVVAETNVGSAAIIERGGEQTTRG